MENKKEVKMFAEKVEGGQFLGKNRNTISKSRSCISEKGRRREAIAKRSGVFGKFIIADKKPLV